MTSQSPRIYIYKITFEEVLYYYYGVKKERYFNQEYWGTPITNKWCWELYTPKKQILQFFDFTDEGWINGLEIEKRLINPVYQTDKWCLNKSCGGIVELKINRKTGKLSAQKCKNLNIGLFSLTKEEMSINGKKGGNKAKELGSGICGLSVEERIKNGNRNYELGVGIHALSPEQKIEFGKNGGEKSYQMKLGVFSLSPEEMSINGKKGGKKSKKLGVGIHGLSKKQMSENGKKSVKQKWECRITGYVSTAAGVVSYQKGRGIDTSKRERIK